MGKLIVLMGKSASGKDTIFNLLKADESLELKQLIPYTTRPKRAGEREGEAYHFVTEEEFNLLLEKGRVIEHRSYHTIHGLWRYFTVEDEHLDLSAHSYILIGTLEAYISIVEYFGKEKVVPVFVSLDDGLRLERALMREREQQHPKYEELCRRFLADSADYSQEKIKAAGIKKIFENTSSEESAIKISAYINRLVYHRFYPRILVR
jgi:guanylate kinase